MTRTPKQTSIRLRFVRVIVLALVLTGVACTCDEDVDPDGCFAALFLAPDGTCPLYVPAILGPNCHYEVVLTSDPNCPDCSGFPPCPTKTMTVGGTNGGGYLCVPNCTGL